jgi:hypothetical protein
MESPVLLKSSMAWLASSKTSFGSTEGPELKLCITDFADSIMISPNLIKRAKIVISRLFPVDGEQNIDTTNDK